MEMIFFTHIALAYLSLALLLTRGVLSARMVNWRQFKLLRIAPHAIDTLLLATGIGLFALFGFPLENWLFIKLMFIVLYVLFSIKAFKKDQPFSLKHFLLAVISFMLAMLVASSN